MSNYSSVTARSQKQVKVFKNITKLPIDDYSCFDLRKNLYVGLVNYGKSYPVTSYLLKEPLFLQYAQKINENFIIDVKKLSKLPKNIQVIVNNTLNIFKDYGGHLNNKGEHVISLKSPVIGPHFAINLLLGDRTKFSEPLLTTPKSVVDQFGGGSFRGPAANQVLATKWDMAPEENGNPFNRQFYILESGKQIFYSHNINENVKSAVCTHKVNNTVIEYETFCGLKIKRIIYIKPQVSDNEPIALERQVVVIENLGKKDRKLEIIFVGMFGSANPGCQMVDVIYQTIINQSNVIYKNNTPIAIAPDYYPEYAREYTRFFSLGEEGFDSFSYDLSDFVGCGSIEHPEKVSFLGNKQKVKGPSFFAVSKKLTIKANDSKVIVSSTGLVDNKHSFYDAIDASHTSEYKNELKQIENNFMKYSSFLQVKTNNKTYDSYINRNLPFQVMYQTYVSRAFAQTQKGYREIGFREIQDIYASMYYFIHNGQQNLVKEMLSKWISNVYEFGYANHNFFFEGKEPGMCSDDQIWLIEAISTYLKLSKDYKFLDEEFVISGTNKKRSLYRTLQSIITYSGKISVGKHGIPLLDKADWNDCLKIDDDWLNGPEKEKLYFAQLKKQKQEFGVPFESNLSESVMNGFLLVIAIRKMIEIAEIHKDNDYKNDLIKLINKLIKSLRENAYINGYYARVLINKKTSKYKYVGAPKDGLSIDPNIDGSLYLNSLSWSILSGVASEKEIVSMLLLCDKYLKTKAGYKLCTPHNLKLCGSKEAATEQYFLGDRENGGVFKHATMMFARAMVVGSKQVKDIKLKKKMLSDAQYILDIVYPFNVYKNLYVIKGNPRFCTQYVNSITNEHIGPILSGTSTWLLLTLLENTNKRLK